MADLGSLWHVMHMSAEAQLVCFHSYISTIYLALVGVVLVAFVGITLLKRRKRMTTNSCCAECGKEEGGAISLKMCRSCMDAKYCNAACQHKHWPMHKKDCKLRVAELRNEALFKDPLPKEDCSICFLPMPRN